MNKIQKVMQLVLMNFENKLFNNPLAFRISERCAIQ